MSIALDKILAASPNTERGRPTQLSSDPKGERLAYAVSDSHCPSCINLEQTQLLRGSDLLSCYANRCKYLLLKTLLISNIQSGKSIFLRSIDDPSLSKQYTSHTSGTTVARFSPSGYYVASGDVSGSVMVWDAVEAANTKGTRLLLLKPTNFNRSARLKH